MNKGLRLCFHEIFDIFFVFGENSDLMNKGLRPRKGEGFFYVTARENSDLMNKGLRQGIDTDFSANFTLREF